MSRKDIGRTCTTGGPDQFSACSGSQCLLGAIGLDRPQIGSPLSYLVTSGPMTMARLPKLMSTDRATTRYNLRPLVRDSFVEISVGEDDRRERIVSVTKQGHKTDACALAAWRRAQTAFEDTMGEREAADMRDLMDRIVDRARTAAVATIRVIREAGWAMQCTTFLLAIIGAQEARRIASNCALATTRDRCGLERVGSQRIAVWRTKSRRWRRERESNPRSSINQLRTTETAHKHSPAS